jgi:pre-rRNA-processing protein TSR4
VPACEHCGAKRVFEFQVTPQLLNYLRLDDIVCQSGADQLTANSCVDWASLYVYTCERNCAAATSSYVNEFIHKQDFVA